MRARETALCALMACRVQDAWAGNILKEYIARDKLDKRDASLATRLCCGVLQNRYLLDFYLKQLLAGKLRDLHPVVRDILHLGLYQLSFLDKIPQSAAVSESVELAKKYCKKQRFAPGLVNGVLRNAVRTLGTLKQPQTLEEKYSHPQALIDLLGSYVGKEHLENMLAANNGQAPTVVQVNTLRTCAGDLRESLSAEGVTVERHPWLADALVLTGTGSLEKLAAFREGLFYVQDAAARLSVQCAGIQKGDRVLDCCSAPGGKSFAAVLAGAQSVISCDIHAHKIPLIRAGARRLGFDCIEALCRDAAVFVPQWEEKMDVVIADVPCSGYGIIRKKPDIRFKRPGDMKGLPELQLQILQNQARYVKPGGTLLYSTCTLVWEENEGVLQAFLESNPDFSPERLTLPDGFPENSSGMQRLIPGEYDTDGFFFGKLRRRA